MDFVAINIQINTQFQIFIVLFSTLTQLWDNDFLGSEKRKCQLTVFVNLFGSHLKSLTSVFFVDQLSKSLAELHCHVNNHKYSLQVPRRRKNYTQHVSFWKAHQVLVSCSAQKYCIIPFLILMKLMRTNSKTVTPEMPWKVSQIWRPQSSAEVAKICWYADNQNIWI